MELSSYVFLPLREGEFILYRGSGNGLAPVLLVAAEDASLGSFKRLKHELLDLKIYCRLLAIAIIFNLVLNGLPFVQ
jgi:hypothetical protein